MGHVLVPYHKCCLVILFIARYFVVVGARPNSAPLAHSRAVIDWVRERPRNAATPERHMPEEPKVEKHGAESSDTMPPTLNDVLPTLTHDAVGGFNGNQSLSQRNASLFGSTAALPHHLHCGFLRPSPFPSPVELHVNEMRCKTVVVTSIFGAFDDLPLLPTTVKSDPSVCYFAFLDTAR